MKIIINLAKELFHFIASLHEFNPEDDTRFIFLFLGCLMVFFRVFFCCLLRGGKVTGIGGFVMNFTGN
jgi:hypothetical protein